MGAVWLARDEVLGRDVAVKRIGLAPGGDSADLDRAEREARLAARLNHPHVVAVFDLVTHGVERWLVMEYVAGLTLAGLVAEHGPLDPDRAAPLVGQAADALAAAHSAGIVHRDVKPSNMLVTPTGQLKLSDFGIARAEADASLTQTGLVTGSPAYLAPEVAAGQQATAASDVWSLGASLFHAVGGRPPYEVGDNLMGALYRIVHEEPPRLDDAGWLGPLLSATMTREPSARWSMAQVRDFLLTGPTTGPHPVVPVPAAPPTGDPARTELLAAPPVGGPTTRTVPADDGGSHRRAAGRWPLVMVAVAVVLVLLLVWAVWSSRDPEDREAGRSPAPTDSPSASRSSPTPDDSTSPDQEAPDREEMEAFITDYLATAPSDPEAGFRMLTPEFQQASGGLEGYRGFWDTVDTAEPVSVSADPRSLTVTYTVAYSMDSGSRQTDEVQLALVQAEGGYKIAGES